MGYRSFRANCVIRTVLLAATIVLAAYLLLDTSLYANGIFVGAVALMQLVALIRYVETTNRELTRFLTSVRYADLTQAFQGKPRGPSFDELGAAFEEVMQDFRRARTEKAEQYQYLQTVIQHIGLGLVAYDRHGEVDLINNAARRLLRVAQLKNISGLESFSPSLLDTLRRLGAGEKALVKIEQDGETLQLAVFATEFRLGERAIMLVSMQNIESELAEKEMEAWQNLIRVLTHEIMNSVTPIASLASTISTLVDRSEAPANDHPVGIGEEAKADIRAASATIEKRSQGLLRFIDAYRNLTRVPRPSFQVLLVYDLLTRVVQLMKDQLDKGHITCSVSVEPKTLELAADRSLVEQVLINVMLNAIQALQDQPSGTIELDSYLDDRGRVVIAVADNGPGITPEVGEKIFTPFFTTRRDGSGIGLSLSRQIMRLHKGTISVQSTPGVRTAFVLRF